VEVAEKLPEPALEVPETTEAAPSAPEELGAAPRLRDRLGKARTVFAGYVSGLRARGRIDQETWDALEEALLRADVGVAATTALLDNLRSGVSAGTIADADALLASDPLALVIGMVAAVGLNVEFRGRSWLRSALLVPYALPVYVAIIVWSFMLQRDNGVLNTLLVRDLHLLRSPPFWLLGSKAFWSMLAAAVWRWFPFAFLILLAALQNIPNELYEAAAVDGASSWRQFRSITLPSVRSANLVLVLVLFLWNFNDFNTPYVLFGNAPPNSADLLSLHIYNVSFESWNFGLGSAMSVLLMLFLLIVSMIYLRVLRKGGEFNV